MNAFNLIDEAWIPVRFPNGRRDELGIRDTLLRAQEITAIEDPSPLVVAALHRFLLALLYRALDGPTDKEQAKLLFREGLPREKITAYLDKWRERFWLFHDQWPFGQIPDFVPKEWRAWTALAAEFNADTSKVLFDHENVQAPDAIQPSAAARWLLAAQTFSVSCGKSELSHTKDAPSATGAMILPLGGNLQDTLLFALVPENRSTLSEDLPLWERNPESIESLTKGSARGVQGIADRYTWRTRSIRLAPDPSGGVRRLAFASGVDYDPGGDRDPMLAYRADEKKGRLAIKFRERGLWRDFDSLLPDNLDAPKLSPQVIQHAIELTHKSPNRFPRVTLALGLVNDHAKIEFWRMERFEFPKTVDRSSRTEIENLLGRAEGAGKMLEKSMRCFARLAISHGERKLQEDKWVAGKFAAGDESKFIGCVRNPRNADASALVGYWSILEAEFHDLLHAYTLDKSEYEIRLQWLEAIRNALNEAWEQHRASVSIGDAWAIRALVKSEGPLRKELRLLNQEIAKLKAALQKEDA